MGPQHRARPRDRDGRAVSHNQHMRTASDTAAAIGRLALRGQAMRETTDTPTITGAATMRRYVFEHPARLIVVAEDEDQARRYMERGTAGWVIVYDADKDASLIETKDTTPDDLPGLVNYWQW